MGSHSVTVFACTDENVAATVLKWQGEIDAAEAEGWTGRGTNKVDSASGEA